MNAQQYSGGTVLYTYEAVLSISYILPTRAIAEGGSPISVFGSGFSFAAATAGVLACRINGVILVAQFNSSSTISCTTVRSPSGYSSVAVTNNGREFVSPNSSNAVAIQFVTVRVTDINPYTGPASGSTVITVTGTDFLVGDLGCKFGDLTPVAATRMSAFLLACYTPSSPSTGWLDLHITSYGTPLESGTPFYYHTPINSASSVGTGAGSPSPPHPPGTVVATLLPTIGPTSGGTIVAISTTNLINTGTLSCRFGSDIVLGRYLADSVLECVTPAHVAGVVAVDVSLNGQQFESLFPGLSFEYLEAIIVNGLTPYRGNANGGQVLEIEGINFVSAHPSAPVCRFGTTTVDATFASATKVLCETPSYAPGYVAVEVSNNLQDFSSSGSLFLFQLISVTSVHPEFTSQLGGEEIGVTGINFLPPNEGFLWCVFGTAVPVLAEWESSTLLRCEAPSTRQVGPVAISIMTNETFYPSTTTLIFVKRPGIVSLVPPRGPRSGGTRVKVRGQNLPSFLTDRCFFGSVMTIPRLRSSTEYECMTPPMPTNLTVQVTVNQDTTSSPVYFRYMEDVVVTALKPNRGPTDGGTYVEVRGLYFDLSSTLLHETLCRFNRTAVPA
eukprot:5470679-Prymnesium_polylepis.1